MKSYIASILALAFVFSFTNLTNAQDEAPSVSKMYNEGLAKLKANNYSEGLQLMEDAHKLATETNNEKVMGLAKKNGAVAANRLASQSYKSGNFDAALSEYERGIALDPANASNLLGKARSLGKKGMTNDAITAFIVAGKAYENAGKAELGSKAYGQAETTIGKLFVAKKYDETIAAADIYLQGNDAPEVHYYLAKSYLEKEDIAKALEHSNKAVTMSGDSAEDKYFMAQGESLEKNGQTAEALVVYKKITGEKYKKYADYKINALKGN